MVHDWHMNALRLPISNWIWAKYTPDYMSKLDQVVQEANAAGLFVVLDLHDTVQSGSPYGTAATLPKTEDIPFWKAIASHYKDNPMVMFDVFNEPKYQNWDQWLHGGGTVNGATVVGTQDTSNRSEEHTSELQSHSDLVCRLLLEKNNKTIGDPEPLLGGRGHALLESLGERLGQRLDRIGVNAAVLGVDRMRRDATMEWGVPVDVG